MNKNNNLHNLIVIIFLPIVILIGIFICIYEDYKNIKLRKIKC